MKLQTINGTELDKFTLAYLECALWASTDENGESLDIYSIYDIAPDSLKAMASECEDFQEANAKLLSESGQSDEQSGHDFWLTRNGHGAGFWDRGLGEVGTKLTDACKPHGSCDLYVGDDGQIYNT